MNPATGSSYPPSGRPDSIWIQPVRWLFAGLALMFVLIGVALFVRILVPGLFGAITRRPAPGFPFDWLWALCVFIVVLWIAMWFVRGAFSIVRGPYPRDWNRWRDGHDGALAIARERYARGEINREQFDQIRRDLE